MFFTREAGELQRLQGYLRRICDLTSPHLPRVDETREVTRLNRTIPVLLAPWENGEPLIGEAATALTKDISDQGLSLTLPQPLRCEQVAVGICLPAAQSDIPWMFRAQVRQNVAIGGAFWALGIEIRELLKASPGTPLAQFGRLARQRLIPPAITARPASTLLD